MDTLYFYEILVEGHLAEHWADWFGDLNIQPIGIGETRLYGTIVDQAALFGILNKIHSLNLTLVSVSRCSKLILEERK